MTANPTWSVRLASRDDADALRQLIELSVRELSRSAYSEGQIDSALKYMFGVDSQLVDDATYYVVESTHRIVGCGGWSRRRTLFGGDQWKHEGDDMLDPRSDSARMRAFFVHPDHARRGIGRLLFDRSMADARTVGFSRVELMATLPGEPLYRALGFSADERVELELPDGVRMPLVRMSRSMLPSHQTTLTAE